jgi:hypothetical protein
MIIFFGKPGLGKTPLQMASATPSRMWIDHDVSVTEVTYTRQEKDLDYFGDEK